MPIMSSPRAAIDSRLFLTQTEEKDSDPSSSTVFTVRMTQSLACELFNEAMIENSFLEAQLILERILHKSRIEIQLDSARALSGEEISLFWHMVARRLLHEPMAYILGNKEFYGHDLLVTKDCLIPRPDTESIVEKCLMLIKPNSDDLIFDIGTGSGAIAISLLLSRPKISLVATDFQENALGIARINAKHHGVINRIKLLQGDLFKPFHQERAHLIVSNPPYIASHEIENLSPTVKNFEPRLALDGGEDGLSFYRRLLVEAYDYLRPSGYLVMEIGFSQKEMIEKLIPKRWRCVEFFRDLAGRERGIVLKK